MLFLHNNYCKGSIEAFANHPNIAYIVTSVDAPNKNQNITGDISTLVNCPNLIHLQVFNCPNVSGSVNSFANKTNLWNLYVNKPRSTLTGTSEQTWKLSSSDLHRAYMVIFQYLKTVLN